MSADLTPDQRAIADQLTRTTLVHGVGDDAEHACSMAAVQLALTGCLTDDRHDCVSPVIHRWVIVVQDRMPVSMMAPGDEHGDRWRSVLPLVAGTAGDGQDQRRVRLILEWMWRCLSTPDGGVPDWVPAAREAWATMLRERTAAAATAAWEAAEDAAWTAAGAATRAATAWATAAKAAAVAAAAKAAEDAAWTAAGADPADPWAGQAWRAIDPASLLASLIDPARAER